MADMHKWRIGQVPFRQLRNGSRRIDARVGAPNVKKVKVGDIIVYEGYNNNEFDVIRIVRYLSFEDMLKSEKVEDVCPGMTVSEALAQLRSIYSRERELLGVYAFEVRPRGDDGMTFQKYYSASELLAAGRHKSFSKVIVESYLMTDGVNKEHPEYCNRFYGEYVPGIFSGKYEIIACYIRERIAGVSILRKGTKGGCGSHMMCVKPNCRDEGIAPELAKRGSAWLGTAEPIVNVK